MKKLPSLLSTITIAGGGIAGIVANSSYPTQQKLVGTSASSLSGVVVAPSSVVAWSNPSSTTFTEVTGTNGLISRLIVTPNGDIYAGTAISSLDGIFTGRVYKKDASENVFKEVAGTTGAIDSLVVTPNGDIYSGTIISAGTEGTTIGKVYKKDANENVFKEVAGTTGAVENLTVTPNGDIYAGTIISDRWDTVNGKVYKKDANENVFKEVTGTNGGIKNLMVTPNGDIYAGTFTGRKSRNDVGVNGKVYKKDANENVFKEVTGTTGEIINLVVTPNGDIYAGSFITEGTINTGKVYKKDANENVFKEVTGTNGGIKNLMVTPNGDIYAGTVTSKGDTINGKVYKKDANENVFKEITGTTGRVDSLMVTPNGDIYAGTFITEGTIITGKVYKKNTNENVFKEITGTNGGISRLIVTPNGDIYVGTFTSSLDGVFAGKVYKKGSDSIANEIFEKWYKFLAPDELKIEFNFNTVNSINVLFEKDKKQEFIKELKLIVNKIPKSDHSGAGGSITEEDINTVANVIWQHFPDFHETFENMTSSQKIIIKTNTVGYWDIDNPNNSIYIN